MCMCVCVCLGVCVCVCVCGYMVGYSYDVGVSVLPKDLCLVYTLCTCFGISELRKREGRCGRRGREVEGERGEDKECHWGM